MRQVLFHGYIEVFSVGYITIANAIVYTFNALHLVVNVGYHFFVYIKPDNVAVETFAFKKSSAATHEQIHNKVAGICVTAYKLTGNLRNKISMVSELTE